jgi:hypothetical protein
MEKKDMDFTEANKKYGLKIFGDVDKDKVPNGWDCKPYDKKRDGIFGRLVNVVSKTMPWRTGEVGQSREDYENERIRKKASRYHEHQEEATRRADLRRAEREAYQEAYKEGRVRRAAKEGSQAGHRRWYDSLQSIGTNPPSRVHRSSGKAGSYSSSVDALFGTGTNYGSSHKKNSGGGKHYAVVGGKAYPVASRSKKKHKKHSRSNSGFGGFDMMDNWGFL